MKELTLKTDAEQATLLSELRVAVATGSFGRVFGNAKDTSAANKARKTIARIMTLRTQKAAKAAVKKNA